MRKVRKSVKLIPIEGVEPLDSVDVPEGEAGLPFESVGVVGAPEDVEARPLGFSTRN